MSVIHEELKRLEEKEAPGENPWFLKARDRKSGEYAFGLPQEFVQDFYDLKEYVRIANLRGHMRVLSIVSSLPGEGSTTVATNLAYLLAGGLTRKKQKIFVNNKKHNDEDQSDVFKSDFNSAIKEESKDSEQAVDVRAVLLVDTNLTNPGLHTHFQMNKEDGLAEVLEADVDWRKMVKSVRGSDLKVLTSGRTNENPAELLGSDNFRELVRQWKKQFRYVIFDSAPVLTAVEALSLAAMADGVIFVVRAGTTRWDIAQSAKRKLVAAHANLLGVALNRQS